MQFGKCFQSIKGNLRGSQVTGTDTIVSADHQVEFCIASRLGALSERGIMTTLKPRPLLQSFCGDVAP